MKSFIVVLVAALATAVAGTSIPNAAPEPHLEARRACKRPSHCSIAWSGKCEGYCHRYLFSHMEKGPCGFLSKRCCCRS